MTTQDALLQNKINWDAIPDKDIKSTYDDLCKITNNLKDLSVQEDRDTFDTLANVIEKKYPEALPNQAGPKAKPTEAPTMTRAELELQRDLVRDMLEETPHDAELALELEMLDDQLK